MNLLGMLLDAQGSPALKQLTSTFGVSEGDAKNALSALVPALARGMQNNLAKQNGVEDLLGALAKGQHQRYIEQPDALPAQVVTADGNAILGHLFGSKDVSRRVASHAAAQTGLDAGLLKKMLPVIAAMVMGSVSKQAGAQKMPGEMAGMAGGAGIGGLLTQFLDADKDGSVIDDLMGMARKFL
ncbi:MAG TPA: DUF937 domain-containing protein [Gammaproteobacteria bacterium]|nr:DUF937 domain-containing protein [Gammaproteobacteria bacterium]